MCYPECNHVTNSNPDGSYHFDKKGVVKEVIENVFWNL